MMIFHVMFADRLPLYIFADTPEEALKIYDLVYKLTPEDRGTFRYLERVCSDGLIVTEEYLKRYREEGKL